MRKIIVLFFAVILLSCTSEKKELYNLAIEEVKANLKAPSSAKFEDYDEKNVSIWLNAGKDSPFMESISPELWAAMSDSLKDYASEEYKYDKALVQGKYEAQNSFGVMLKGKYAISFKRYEKKYCGDKKCEWKIDAREIE